MTRPDEIAALAERLHAASCALLRGDDAVEHVPAICDAEQALRASATSPGDAVREALEESKNWHERADKALSKSGRGDADYHWQRSQHKEEIERIDAALAPAEKAGDDRHPVLYEFMPLSLVPLENPNHDPGEHQVMDSDTAYVFRICGSRERAENIVACLNAYAATPTPPSGDVAMLRHLSGCARAFLQHFNPCDLAEDKAQQWQALEHQCDLADALIQSAAPGGGTKSDGRHDGDMPVGPATGDGQNVVAVECLTRLATATNSSDPAQEPEAVGYMRSHGVKALNGIGLTTIYNEKHKLDGDIALYTRPVSLDREAVARIIYEHCYTAPCGVFDEPWRDEMLDWHNSALRKSADAILALIEGRT